MRRTRRETSPTKMMRMDDETDTHDAPRLPTVGSKSRHTETPKTSKTSRSRATADDSEYDSEDYDDEVDEEYLPFQLPQIGYPDTPSLPPSSQSFRSRFDIDHISHLQYQIFDFICLLENCFNTFNNITYTYSLYIVLDL
ncbi:hypothetical protein DPMN_015366 [Dreissena polymorpha]|uniref:Uncharacterized protein n=1 Tax=Dreissena polymorpha TaxID=45954 RepID=A0A9D4N7M3_DREPO|nr:hypothetical protein DPMN_015366 [Dreissena polymorpha]